jgi:hypothetical protein
MATFQRQLTPVWDRTPAIVSVPVKELSGTAWVQCFPASQDVEDLAEPFRSNVKSFLSALAAAGATVSIANTYRPKERAYLMHYSAAIGRKEIAPEKVPPMDGVMIEWVHPTKEASIRAATAMAKAYDIVYPPALSSNHTRRRAIDMRISDIVGKSVVKADGTEVIIRKHAETDSDLFAVGASYNVFKLVSDKPHWSDDGH